jgi:hypothetical protein
MKGQVMAIYQHIRHPRIAARRADRPVKVMDLLPHGTPVARFNQWFAVKITTGSARCGAPTPSPRWRW